MAIVSGRYIVADLEAELAFYTARLGFSVELHPAPPQAMVAQLRGAGVRFRSELITGIGGDRSPWRIRRAT
jgi:hypothetical protein